MEEPTTADLGLILLAAFVVALALWWMFQDYYE